MALKIYYKRNYLTQILSGYNKLKKRIILYNIFVFCVSFISTNLIREFKVFFLTSFTIEITANSVY